MKIRQIMLASCLLLSGLLGVSAAHANVVDFTGDGSTSDNVNVGTVAVGQSGTIYSGVGYTPIGPYTFGTGSAYGFLPADSAITFTYTYNNVIYGALHAYSSYDYTSNGNVYSGNSSSYSNGFASTAGTVNGVPSAPLVFASANQNAAGTVGTTSIINVSGGLAQIQSLFSALFDSTGSVTSVTYNVSSVPLPASFPMFAAVIASITGFALLRKRRNI